MCAEAWLIETGTLEQKYRRSLQNITLATTFYPGNPQNYWGGLFLRFGFGLGVGGTAKIEIEEQKQIDKLRFDEIGTGVIVGLGYEFRITPSFAAGVSVSSNYLKIKKDFVHEAWFAPLCLDLAWYF